MNEGCCLFSKSKINITDLIEKVGFDTNRVLIINDVNDWIKKENEDMVIEYNGMLSEEDHEKYAGYYYYQIMAENKEDIKKIEYFNDKNIIIE